MENLKSLQKHIRNCGKCLFNKSTDARYCGGVGTDYRVMFIAESPSTSGGTGIFKPEKNFSSTHADNLFREVKTKFGLENCYTTDLVKCGIPKGKPTNQKINNCLNYLKQEIKIVKPKVIVAVGKDIKIEENGRLVSKGNFSEFLKQKLETIHIVPTWHYSYVWNRCQLRGKDRYNPQIPQIKPDKMNIYEKQHEEILKYL